MVKGVADYLRFAGEERIKKWRRHVRMVGEWPWFVGNQDVWGGSVVSVLKSNPRSLVGGGLGVGYGMPRQVLQGREGLDRM